MGRQIIIWNFAVTLFPIVKSPCDCPELLFDVPYGLRQQANKSFPGEQSAHGLSDRGSYRVVRWAGFEV